MNIDAKEFGLSSRVKLEQLNPTHITIIKTIKSRIIQKDALKIIEVSNAIKQVNPDTKVSLTCNPNICSKSIALLAECGVGITYI